MKSALLSLFTILFVITNTVILNAQTWVKVSAGGEFSLGLRSDGTLWAWGSNMNGQLGIDSDEQFVLTPTQVGGDTDWVDIAAGGFHALAIKSDGSLWSWGWNGNGQTGVPGEQQYNLPVRIDAGFDWASIDCGMMFSAAIKNDGTLWMWGYNQYGTLGNATTTDADVPVQTGTETWRAVACGGLHALGVRSDSTLWAWGFNGNGQVGTGDTEHKISPSLIDNGKWKSIDAGFEYCAAVKEDGTLWTWGFNGGGQLGSGNKAQANQPAQAGALDTWEEVYTGSVFAFAKSVSGEIYGWGTSIQGMLGLGDLAERLTPTLVSSLQDCNQIAPAAGVVSGQTVFGLHTLALCGDQRYICVAGANYIGQLGDGTIDLSSLFSCTVTVGLDFIPGAGYAGFSFELYPTPVSDAANATFTGSTTSGIEFTVCDILGKNVYRGVSHTGETVSINTASLPEGIYILSAISGSSKKSMAFSVQR